MISIKILDKTLVWPKAFINPVFCTSSKNGYQVDIPIFTARKLRSIATIRTAQPARNILKNSI